jgi:hypothetical protein
VRDVAATICFATFVLGIALVIPKRSAHPAAGRRRASGFALLVTAVSLSIGVTESDLYPFSSWPLVAWLYPDSISFTRFVAVDAVGAELQVDHRAWEPQSVDELATWMATNFLRLEPSARDEVARDLMDRANAAARRVRAGEPIGVYARLLGPLAAPLFHLHPRPWSAPDSLPPLPLRGLRLYSETWTPEERARDPSAGRRRLLYEYQQP